MESAAKAALTHFWANLMAAAVALALRQLYFFDVAYVSAMATSPVMVSLVFTSFTEIFRRQAGFYAWTAPFVMLSVLPWTIMGIYLLRAPTLLIDNEDCLDVPRINLFTNLPIFSIYLDWRYLVWAPVAAVVLLLSGLGSIRQDFQVREIKKSGPLLGRNRVRVWMSCGLYVADYLMHSEP